MFLRVHLICVSPDSLLYLAKPSTTIDHSAPVKKWHLNLQPRPLTLTLNFDLDLWPWPLTLTSKQVKRQQNVKSKHVSNIFDLDLWPTTLTYNPRLVKVKDPHAKNQGRRSNGSSVRALMDRQTDGRTDGQMDATKSIISLTFYINVIILWSFWCTNFIF